MDEAADRGALPLDQIIVRPVRCEERARWRDLMRTHHYLSLSSTFGPSLCYVALFQEQWIALLGWGVAALKCAPRDAWIGWSPQLRGRRLHLLANNVRFLVLPAGRHPNVASRVLALNTKRLSQDWERYYGHPILLGETFVDTARFRGTCYRAAGWLPLGQTLGFARRGRGYVAHGRPKLVLVRPLGPDARKRLLASFLPPSRKENPSMDVNRLPLEGEGGLIERLHTVVDPRKPRGVRHPVVTVVAIAACAALSGARGFSAIAEWAQDLSRETLRRLGSWRWTPPSEPTFRRVLQKLDADALDAKLGPWLLEQGQLKGQAVSVDGKTLRRAHDVGTQPPHLFSAILHQEKIVVAQLEVGEKTNEIPELPRLLEPLPLEGIVVTADAMHTQENTARYIVEEKKADYVFTVKDNQPTLKQDIADLHLDSFPPSAHHLR